MQPVGVAIFEAKHIIIAATQKVKRDWLSNRTVFRVNSDDKT